jgi:hypothetical protein
VPSHPKAAALKLPDQLLVRYFRGGEIEGIAKVEVRGDKVDVRLKVAGKARCDRWRDLGGGLGYVPDDGVKPTDA